MLAVHGLDDIHEEWWMKKKIERVERIKLEMWWMAAAKKPKNW